MDLNALKNAQKELKEILRPLEGCLAIGLKKSDEISDFKKKFQYMPSGKDIGIALEEWIQKTSNILQEMDKERHDRFNRFISDFIRKIQEREQVREMNNAWRIGPLSMQLDTSKAMIRFCYNEEQLIKWRPVQDSDDIYEQFTIALNLLKAAEIDLGDLEMIFNDAYDFLHIRREKSEETDTKQLLLRDFYDEVKISLYRCNSNKKTKVEGFPFWAFLFNLDRYLKAAKLHDRYQRFILQDGSQFEVSKYGVCVNGLEPFDDYKMVCYIYR